MNPITQILWVAEMWRPIVWTLQILATISANAARRWRQRAALRQTRRALAALDAQTLRDLGLHECEAASCGAEYAGLAEASRQRIVPILAFRRGVH